ncbi:agmatine deiminase family protein [Desulfocurvibacter africanus]|uniref:Agmatine deiminase n=1 Tax=Desulfocurvibacter africanus subsp. africanus str. Walvis Bay TaxID=690850 RepID=F3Z0L9_DESAF|nr:agmatine deiminase family protein [Desulfocurvibacter africanus]EGJ49843.1 Agmatine deiminase [Desulfocurvibacter africanus subsp. africanus str. Walvis Bay]
MSETPRAYRLPAEWEKHEATWLVWPQYREDWPGKFAVIPWCYAEMVRKLAASETVRLLVDDESVIPKAKRVLEKAHADLSAVEFVVGRTNRGWARDTLPAFVKNGEGGTLMAAFRFNGWAKYKNHTYDARVPEYVRQAVDLPLLPIEHKGRQVVLEGGALDVNGTGTILVTEECLQHPDVQVRNPGFTKDDYAEMFGRWLGAGNVVWLPGGVAGDDTHGHVDDVCRFVNRTTVVHCREDDPADPNHAILRENMAILKDARLEDGARLEVVDLPMPRPLYYGGMRLPASYANFYIANTAVLVPTFNDPADYRALGILANLFPGRAVTGIHAVDLVLGQGSVHCLTHEQYA